MLTFTTDIELSESHLIEIRAKETLDECIVLLQHLICNCKTKEDKKRKLLTRLSTIKNKDSAWYFLFNIMESGNGNASLSSSWGKR